MIQRNTSKIAISSDIWTSKSSVFAFAGVVGYWISSEWVLVECPFNLLLLEGDHSGAHAARKIHKELRRRDIVKKLGMI